jgi:hypothetical protein
MGHNAMDLDGAAEIGRLLLAKALERDRQTIVREIARNVGRDDVIGPGGMRKALGEIDDLADDFSAIDDRLLHDHADAHV